MDNRSWVREKNNIILLLVPLFVFCILGAETARRYVTDAELEQYYKKHMAFLEKDCPAEYIEHMKEATAHLARYRFEESIASCRKALAYRTNDHIARALICLNYYELGEQLDVKDPKQKAQRKEIYNDMIGLAEEGIKLSPEEGECYFMRGLARARKATTTGIMYSLYSAKLIEDDWLKAISSGSLLITPTGENILASAHLGLGAFYRMCPDMFLAQVLLGTRGDIDKSIRHLEKALALDPKSIEITLELGVSHITRGLKNKDEADIEKGKEYLRKVETLPKKLKTDEIDIRNSKILLEDIKLCPGYSRDQQQDVSDKAMKEGMK